MVKQPTSFRLSDEALRLIRELSERLGVSQADVVEMGARQLAEKLGREPSVLRRQAKLKEDE